MKTDALAVSAGLVLFYSHTLTHTHKKVDTKTQTGNQTNLLCCSQKVCCPLALFIELSLTRFRG